MLTTAAIRCAIPRDHKLVLRERNAVNESGEVVSELSFGDLGDVFWNLVDGLGLHSPIVPELLRTWAPAQRPHPRNQRVFATYTFS